VNGVRGPHIEGCDRAARRAVEDGGPLAEFRQLRPHVEDVSGQEQLDREDVGQQVERLVGLPDAERCRRGVVLHPLVQHPDVEADRGGQLAQLRYAAAAA
jgi:hypothetical protein